MKVNLTARLKKYGALAVAGAASMTATQYANADIIYSGIQNIAVPANFTGVYLDLDGLTFNTTGSVTGSDYNIWFNADHWDTFHPNGATTADIVSGAFVANLAYGTPVVGATNTTLADLTNGSTGTFDPPNGAGYIGVSIAGVGPGWIQLANVDQTNQTLTVVDWAFENAGGSIFAGQTSAIPEPISVVLVGLAGVFVLTSSRRRR